MGASAKWGLRPVPSWLDGGFVVVGGAVLDGGEFGATSACKRADVDMLRPTQVGKRRVLERLEDSTAKLR